MSKGGPCPCRCYRDTKMEIQGLSEAPNILSQHGASHGTAAADANAISSPEKDPADSQEPLDTPISHHNRSRTAAFCLLLENGSESACSPVSKPQTALQGCLQNSDAPVELRNVNKDAEFSAIFGPNGCVRTAWKYDLGSGDNAMQMTVPLFEGEEELELQQLTLPSAGLRQQREDGPSLEPDCRPHRGLQEQPPEPDCRPHRGPQEQPPEPASRPHRGPQEQPPEPASRPHRGPQEQPPEPASRPHRGQQEQPPEPASRPHRGPQELYVVLNFLQDGKDNLSCEDGNKLRGKTAEPYKSDLTVLMEAENGSNAAFVQSGGKLNCLDAPNLKRTGFSTLHDTSVMVNAEQEADSHIMEKVVLTNKYGEKICGRISTENNEVRSPCPEAGESRALMPGTAEMEDNMDTSELITDPSGPQSSVSPVSASISPPLSDTFSGTITINNQSIIVSIENGVLTLAAPPEGCVHKEDDMVSLKEHLGMKDHEDIVLLNYDSGTKSIGKISTLALTSSSQQEEPRLGLSVSDSEFAFVDDCALSELGTSLDSCPIVKQEAGLLCAVTEGNGISPSSGVTVADCGNDAHTTPLIRSRKDMTTTVGCPEPGCSCFFDTRQKLKVHLLNHAEEPRPYQCSVEGCGWAFATSYKLKRHLRSHDKQRPHSCQFEGCGRRFTTVYNLKAHIKVHEQDGAFICEICSESFRSATRLSSHQRVHFEPQRPHKCEFPGCEKTFITFSALFSHNRTHFRESGHFTCTFPGCDKTYDKACRLKIHMRSHTGERPFVCDSEDCGWSFTSMSKLLRHKRKHDDDRRFVCTEEGCGKSFTRAEHLKGHSITHLGTKPFQCHAEGCNAKFSARSSLYIHSKKHKQDASTLRTRCPVANCSKHFSSRSSLKSHMVKHHRLNADVLSQMETTPTLTPSSELISSPPTTGSGPGVVGSDQLANLDLSSLFSVVPGSTVPTAGIGVGIPVAGGCSNSIFTMDLSLVSSGILTIDPSSVGSTLSGGTKALDPLILTACADMCPHHGLDSTVGNVLPPQGTLNLDDVQTVTPEALGTLTALTMQGAGSSVDPCLQHHLSVDTVAPLAVAPVPELLTSPSKVGDFARQSGSGPLLSCVEALGAQEGGKVLTQFVFPSRSSSSFSPQTGPELNTAGPSSFLESGGSARTDYRAIQLAKKKKQRGPAVSSGTLSQRKGKGVKAAAATSTLLTPSGARYTDGTAPPNGGLSLRDPVSGGQYVHIQLLQDDPAADGDLAFQLSSQPSSSHSQLTVDLPANILQEPSVMTEDDDNSDNSQFTGSTINLQDLE